MRLPTMWHFDMNRQGESVEPPFKNRNSKCCSSVAYKASNIQENSKGSDQIMHMRRLV